MVNQSVSSLLAQYADDEEFDIRDTRPQSIKREQPSLTRFATQARYSRKKANSSAPTGPRRRLRKAS